MRYYGNLALPTYGHGGAWTILDLRNNRYRFRMNEIWYYPDAQTNAFDPTGGVARINTPTVDFALGSDGNSFTTTRADTLVYYYDRSGNLLPPPNSPPSTPPGPQDLGPVGQATGSRITTDFVPPAHFPFGTY